MDIQGESRAPEISPLAGAPAPGWVANPSETELTMEDDASRVIGCNTYLPVWVGGNHPVLWYSTHAFSHGGGLDRDPVETPRRAHSGSREAQAVEPERVFREGEQEMRAWANGDAAAGHAVYVSFRARVRGRVKQLAPAQDVDDLCQQVWLEVTRCRCDWRGPGVAGWLATIVRRTVAKSHDCGAREASKRDCLALEPTPAPVTVERTMVRVEVVDQLLEAKARARAAAVAYWAQGYSSAEVGAMTGQTPAAARQMVVREIERVRKNVCDTSADLPAYLRK